VEEEVSRVKVMFESKEARLRSERDAARRQLEATEALRSALDAQVGRHQRQAALELRRPKSGRSGLSAATLCLFVPLSHST
jgi:hypothetical protein